MTIQLPYGRGTVSLELPEERVAAVLRGEGLKTEPEAAAGELVRRSMERPIGSPRLRELAKGRRKVVLIASDHTRPVPSKVIVPAMLREIREGNPEAEVTILIATGCHRHTTREELTAKFGQDIVDREEIVVHDCDGSDMAYLGRLPSGGELWINALAAEADLLVAEGFIEPHFFAGFSGGRKSVLPGIASRACVRYNHNSSFMDDPHARSGELERNPIHRDMLFAARAAKLAYIVNVVLNTRGEVIASFAGDCGEAHRAGAAYVAEKMSCSAKQTEIVITTNNGYPMDQNLYQMVKGMCTAERCCQPGGVIIAVGKCEDGLGGEEFYRTFQENSSPGAILEVFRKTPPQNTRIDQWQSHILARIMENHRIVLLSDLDQRTVRDFKMIPAASMEEALAAADRLLGHDSGAVTVIPEGISVIIR